MYDDNVQLTFESERTCTIVSIVGSGQCTYSVSGEQVSITFKETTYVLNWDHRKAMEGNFMGAGIALACQVRCY